MKMIEQPNSPFWDNPVKLSTLEPIDAKEHERRWNAAMGAIKKGDMISTTDTKSLMSKVIRYL
jgi:hypothetical protein